MQADAASVVLTTFPGEDEAARVAEGLLERRLAACVQMLAIQSTYRWEGATHRDPEVLLLIKTRASHYSAVEAYIRSVHSYQTPEILMLPVAAGLADYLRWITDETRPPQSDSSPG
jgi:periplasmic divalent cation tolerance protein